MDCRFLQPWNSFSSIASSLVKHSNSLKEIMVVSPRKTLSKWITWAASFRLSSPSPFVSQWATHSALTAGSAKSMGASSADDVWGKNATRAIIANMGRAMKAKQWLRGAAL